MAIFELKGVSGQLQVFDDRVVIIRKGGLAFISHGFAGEKSIPMSSIQSVQFVKANAFINGYIQFGILGGKESRGGSVAATTDENTITFRSSDNDLAGKIKLYIENIIFNRSNNASVSQNLSSADEIAKFKALLDSGVISQEEFDLKKQQLLGL